LSVIYYVVDRFAAAYGAAQSGLDFLRRTGRKEYRPFLHRVLAEQYIKNRSYLEAVQQLDLAIRQDPDPRQAAPMFARIGDIYYNLNNFELAEDVYALAESVNRELNQLEPLQLVLRAESLFWLGKFSEAQKMLDFAINAPAFKKVNRSLTPVEASYAHLRLGDAYMARKMYNEARLQYFKIRELFRGSEAAKIANVRWACLGLPYYEGNNVEHARALLQETKDQNIMPQVTELSWACHVGSYAQRERTPAMVDRVRSFAGQYPMSNFLKTLVEPVREVQASKIDDYFKAGDQYGAIAFYEANKDVLFKKIDDALKSKLYIAYVDTFKSDASVVFYPAYKQLDPTDMRLIREVAMLSEVLDKKKHAEFAKRNMRLSTELEKRPWTIKPVPIVHNYLMRILATKSKSLHTTWIYNLASKWAETDRSYLCSIIYPMLSSSISKPYSKTQVVNWIDKDLPALFDKDSDCARSFLELEMVAMGQTSARLATRYMQRAAWLKYDGVASLTWAIAEAHDKNGQKPVAKRLWQMLKDSAPKDAPETRFAAARLDPSRTEFEGLWE
jgi:hypothetical protein